MKQSGQAVLMVLLIVAVALGLGISVISQSTTDVRMTQQEQESARAFNAAEAGIEQALQQISTIGAGTHALTVDDIPVEYTVTDQDYLEAQFLENESAQIILDGEANNLTIEWVDAASSEENPDNCDGAAAASGETAASLLISVVQDDYVVRRYGVNACALNSNNDFTDISQAGSDRYLRRYNLPVVAGDQLVRIRPLYNLTSLRVTASGSLPAQAHLITSAAQVETQESKAIEVTRLEPGTPSIFDYVIFSGGNLTH